MSEATSMVPGIDLVAVADVDSSVREFGDRYLTRVFTTDELTAANAFQGAMRTQHLAGRFAAKEAVFKALRYPRDAALPWLDIEILSADAGWPFVILRSRAEIWARDHAVASIAVSISHDDSYATAVALALPAPCSGCGSL